MLQTHTYQKYLQKFFDSPLYLNDNVLDFYFIYFIFQWDIRTGEAVQEYDRHLGAVQTQSPLLTKIVDFVTTSDGQEVSGFLGMVCIKSFHFCILDFD